MRGWGVIIFLLLAVPSTAAAFSQNEIRPMSGEQALISPFARVQGPSPLVPGPGYDDASEFFMGKVAVGVFLVESTGSAYDWSDAEVLQTLNGIYGGLGWWASKESKGRLSFSYELHVREPTTWEPIANPLADDWLWIDEILGNLGYAEPDPWSKSLHFNNDLRGRLGTDWAYSLFVADSDNPANLGRFTDNQYAHAYYGGPWITMSRFSSWAYNSGDYYRVVPAHETGHIFYATDEYDSNPTEYSGYLNCPDNNGATGIMNRNTLIVSESTRCQIGWVDGDGNGILDMLDAPPDTTLVPYNPDPTGDTVIAYRGTARVVAQPNRNPKGPGNDVTISRITGVSVRADGSPWSEAAAADGAFDDFVEDFTVPVQFISYVNALPSYVQQVFVVTATTPLQPGTHLIEARAENTEGNSDPTPATDSLTTTAQPISRVELWYNRAGAGYALFATAPGEPWAWTLNSSTTGGDGYYEFYSVAVDVASNVEPPPPFPDTSTVVDSRAPVSRVGSLTAYETVARFPVTASASDPESGVAQVSLLYRKGGGAWAVYGIDAVPPWLWDFDTAATGGDGLYEFRTVAVDAAGNVEAKSLAAEASTTVDTAAPSSFVDPLPVYSPTVFTITATATDAVSGVRQVELRYRRNGGPWITQGVDTSEPFSWNFDTAATGGDGFYEFLCIALDSATNSEVPPTSSDASTTVDTLAPTSSVNGLPAYRTTTVFSVTATASDSLSGVSQVDLWYRHDGGPWRSYGVDASLPWAWTFDTAGTGGDGVYDFYAVATDAAGNMALPPLGPDASTTVDTATPYSSVQSLSDYQVAGSFIVTATAADSGSGTSRVELFFRRDGGAWASYGVRTSPPWSWAFDTASTGGDGFYEFYASATDRAGNVEADASSAEASTTVDTRPPTMSYLILGTRGGHGWYTTGVTVILAATDAASGIAALEYDLDGLGWSPYTDPVQVTDEGTHVLRFRAVDLAGNEADSETVSLDVDRTPPVLALDTPAADSWVRQTSVRIAWSGTDATSGIDRFEVLLDGRGAVITAARAVVYTDLSQGTHAGVIRAYDVAGNRREAAVLFSVDSTPPVVAIETPSSGAVVGTQSVTLHWDRSDAGSGIKDCSISVDGRAPTSVGMSMAEKVLDLPDGTHEVRVACEDVAGNRAEVSTLFRVDTNPISPTGPFGPTPLIGLTVLGASAIGLGLLAWRRKRRQRPSE